MSEDCNYEDVIANVEKIANMLGVGFNGLSSTDLHEAQTFLSKKLSGDVNAAQTVVKLATSMARGKNPQREIEKLRKKVTIIPEMPTSSALPNAQTINEQPPFSNRTALARKRLPKSGGHFAGWTIETIFRGPRTRKK